MSEPLEIVTTGYDTIAPAYLAWSEVEDFPARRRYLAYLVGALERGSTVLELGCGAGIPVTKALAEHFRVTAVDVSRRQLELARENVPDAVFVRADMASLDLPAAAFDAVIAVHSITHVPRELHAGLFEHVHRWLRPGGILVASLGTADDPGTVEEDWLGAPMFFSHYDADTSRRLVRQAGFELVEDEVVTQLEHGQECRFLWIVASRP